MLKRLEPTRADLDAANKSTMIAVEARTETKFAQLLGELKVIATNMVALGTQMVALGTQMGDVKTELANVKSATAGVKWNIVALGLTMGGLIIAIAAFGTQILDLATGLVGVHK